MSPETPLNTATLPPKAAAPESPMGATVEVATMDPTQVVSTYADTLMAGLFGDLDRLLDGDEAALVAVEDELKHPPQPAEVEVSPPLVDQEPETAQETALTAPTTALAPLPEVAEQPTPTPPTKTPLGKLFDRLLLACTALSLAGIVVFLWLGQRPQSTPSSDAALDSAAAQSDAEFLAYLQRSLDAVEKQVAHAQADASQPQPPLPNTALLPPGGVLLPSQRTDLGVPGRINVIERVYIPYQATPPTLPSAPPTAVVPPTPPGSLPTLPIAPPTAGAPTPPQPSAPVVNHVLVGVLELGDRSAALFEINGVSQRVYIGERIGNAGWSLVSVSNQEAVIRRNGEVRSIYIGQQF